MRDKAHQCACENPTGCPVNRHPSEKVQSAIDELVEAVTEFDNAVEAKTTVVVSSVLSSGTYKSVTGHHQGELLSGR